MATDYSKYFFPQNQCSEAELVTASGTSTIYGHFFKSYDVVKLQDLEFEGNEIVFECETADVQNVVSNSSNTLNVTGETTYKIKNKKDVGGGVSILILGTD